MFQLHISRRLGTLAVAAAWSALAPGLAGAADSTPACDIETEITPRADRQPRVLAVTLRFDAEDRRETVLRMTPSWAGINDFGAALGAFAGETDGVTIEPLPGTPMRWRVQHAPGQRVGVRYEVRAALADPDDGRPQDQEQLYRPQIGRDSFQFFGHGVLPAIEPWGDPRTARLCVTLRQPGQPSAPAIGSHHAGRGEAVQSTFTGSPALLRHAFYAGGEGWRTQERPVVVGVLRTAVRGRFAVTDGALADAVAALVDGHRRFWGEATVPPPSVLLTPNFQPRNVGGTVVHQAVAMHAGPDFSPTHPSFEFLLGHEHLHQWFPQRFGTGDPDAVKAVHGYWFSEGFTNYYAHRLLLTSGLWDLPRYAANLTTNLRQYWRSPAREAPVASIAPRFFSDRDAGQQLYSRGEWLAMRWDRALRDRGHEGLDAVLRGLLLPIRSRGPEPGRATERVLQALSSELGTLPRRDVERHIEGGATLVPDADLAGPCFSIDWSDVPRWVLGFDTASFAERRVTGVQPGGPAHAAGLRDGMPLLAWSVYGDDTARDVELTVAAAAGQGGSQVLRYRPVDGSAQRLPTARVRPDAAVSTACQAWLRR